MDRITLSICTPDRRLYNGVADYLLFTTPEGDKGIRPGHENAVLQVLPGDIEITAGHETLTFRTQGGLLCFEGNRASLITHFAALSEEYEQRYGEHAQLLERRYVEGVKSESELQRAQMVMRQSLMQE